METATAAAEGRKRAGLGSWPDWLIARIRALPGPLWLGYLALFAVLLVSSVGARWVDGGVTFGDVPPLAIFEVSFPVALLAGLDWLNSVALRSLATLRPALTIAESGATELADEIVRTPPRWALAAAVAAVVFAPASILSGPEAYGLGRDAGPVMWIWELSLTTVTIAVTFAFMAHTLHQLRLVARVHRDMVRVDLFGLDPLYGFASLTSWTGIMLFSVTIYGVGAIYLVTGAQLSVVDSALVAGILLIVTASFLLPLLGLHDKIGEEKARRRAAVASALDNAVSAVQESIRAGDYQRTSQLNDALTAATSALSTVSRISTWPWRPETIRGFLGAIGVPILIWTITAVLSRYV